jgi:hypothetical protein
VCKLRLPFAKGRQPHFYEQPVVCLHGVVR